LEELALGDVELVDAVEELPGRELVEVDGGET
jgi:hypothetical protein